MVTKMSEYKIEVNWEKQDIPYKHMVKVTSEDFPKIIATSPENRGGYAGYWSPEHLFVAAASICLSNTFLTVAKNSNLQFEKFRMESTGMLDLVDINGVDRNIMAEIHEKFYIKLTNSKFEKKARKILKKSVENCIIGNSVKSKLTVNLFFE